MVLNHVENDNPLMNGTLRNENQETFWQSILHKYEERNLVLSRKQLELENRLKSINCPVSSIFHDRLHLQSSTSKADAAQSLLNSSNTAAKEDLDSLSSCNPCKIAQANDHMKLGTTHAFTAPLSRSFAYNPKTHLTLQNCAPLSSYLNQETDTMQQDEDSCFGQQDLSKENALASEKLKSVKVELLKQCMKRLEVALNQRLQREQTMLRSPQPMLYIEPKDEVSSAQMQCVSNLLTELTCTCNSHISVKELNNQLLVADAENMNDSENLNTFLTMKGAMGDNKIVGNEAFNATDKESLNTIARQLSKTLLEMEKCHKCRQVHDDVKHTVKCIKCLLDILHKISLKKQDRTVGMDKPHMMSTSTEPKASMQSKKNRNSIGIGTDIPITAEKGTLSPQYYFKGNIDTDVNEYFTKSVTHQADKSIQYNNMNGNKETSHNLLDELEIITSRTGVTEADSEVKLKLSLHEEADADITITFTVDSCGIIREVLTEGPNGIINSILYYTDSGTIDIVTEIMTVPESGYDKVVLQGLAKLETLPPPCPGGITLLVSELADDVGYSSMSQAEEKKRVKSALETKFRQKMSKISYKHNGQEEKEEEEKEQEKSASTSCETLYTKSQLSDILESLCKEKVRPERNKATKTTSLESSSSSTSAYTDAVIEHPLADETSEVSKGEENAATYESCACADTLKELTIPTSWTSAETTEVSRLQKHLLVTTTTETELSIESLPAETVINLATDATTADEMPADSVATETALELISTNHSAEEDTRSLTESLSGRGLTLEDVVTEEVMDNDLSSKEEAPKIDSEEVIAVVRQPLDEEITGKASLTNVAIDSPQPADYWKTVCDHTSAASLPDRVHVVRRHTSLIKVNKPIQHSEYWSGLYSSQTKSIFSTKRTYSSTTSMSITKIFEAAAFSTETESSMEETAMFHKSNKELKSVEEQTDILKLQLNHELPEDKTASTKFSNINLKTENIEPAKITLSVDLVAAKLYSVSSSAFPSVLRPTNRKSEKKSEEVVNVEAVQPKLADETFPCSSTSEATCLLTDTPTLASEAKVEDNKLTPIAGKVKTDDDSTLESKKSQLTEDSSTETDFHAGVVGALQKANQDVMNALEQANKYVTEALEKVNKDVNFALALATKGKGKTKKRTRKHSRRTILESIPQEIEACNNDDTSGYLPDTEMEESDTKSNAGAGEQLTEEKLEGSKRKVLSASSTKFQSPRTSLTLGTATSLKSQNLSEKLNRVARQKPNSERRKKNYDKSKRASESTVEEGEESQDCTYLPNTSFATYEISRFLKTRHYVEAAVELVANESPSRLEKRLSDDISSGSETDSMRAEVQRSVSSKTCKISEEKVKLEMTSPTQRKDSNAKIVSNSSEKEASSPLPQCESPSTDINSSSETVFMRAEVHRSVSSKTCKISEEKVKLEMSSPTQRKDSNEKIVSNSSEKEASSPLPQCESPSTDINSSPESVLMRAEVQRSVSSKTYRISEEKANLEISSSIQGKSSSERIVSNSSKKEASSPLPPSTKDPPALPKRRSKLPVPVQTKKRSTGPNENETKLNAVSMKPSPPKVDNVKEQNIKKQVDSAVEKDVLLPSKTKSPTKIIVKESPNKSMSDTRSFKSEDQSKQNQNASAKKLPIRPKSSPLKESVPPVRMPPRQSDRAVKTPTEICRSTQKPLAAEGRKLPQEHHGFLTYLNDRYHSENHYKTRYIKPRPSSKQNCDVPKPAKRKPCRLSDYLESCYDCKPSKSCRSINSRKRKPEGKRKSVPSSKKQNHDKDSDTDKSRCRSRTRVGTKVSKRSNKRGLSLERDDIQKQLMIMFAREGAQMAEYAATQRNFSNSDTDATSETSFQQSEAATNNAICNMLRSTTVVENEIRDLESETSRILQKWSERQCRDASNENLYQPLLSDEEHAFQSSLNRLQTALSTLRNKCQLKDNLISTMSEQLRLRTTSRDLELVLQKLIVSNQAEIDNRSRSAKTRQTPQERMNSSYPNSEVQEMRMPFPPKSSRQLTSKHFAEPNRQRFISKTPSVSSEAVSNSPPLQIVEVRQIGSASLLVKWVPLLEKNIAGYEIAVDGEVITETLDNKTTSAILQPLTLKDTVSVSIYAVRSNGQYFPPATTRYKVY